MLEQSDVGVLIVLDYRCVKISHSFVVVLVVQVAQEVHEVQEIRDIAEMVYSKMEKNVM